MKELEVQKYLRSNKTLDDLKDEYSIKYSLSECGKLVNLKYNQIESDKNLNIVRECRGVILEVDSWNLVSRGFYRFFNYGEYVEGLPEFNFSSNMLSVQEKSDGSVIQLFYYDNNWRISTSGTIDANCNIGGNNYTFRNLFDKALNNMDLAYCDFNPNLIYVFELISPINRVVRLYDKTSLVLLNVRNTETFDEVNLNRLEHIADHHNIPMSKTFNLSSESEILEEVEKLDQLHEGFVIVDYSNQNEYGDYSRIKLKASEYVKLHHLKESKTSSVKALLNVVIDGEVDEVCAYFEELKKLFEPIESAWFDFKTELRYAYNDVKHLINEDMSKEDNKTLALTIMDDPYKHFIFNMKSKNIKSVDELIGRCFSDEIGRIKLIKWVISHFKLKEIEQIE